MITYPNQKMIRINKLKRQKGQKGNPYAIINVKACNAASYILSPSAFRLYMYLMLNQDSYTLALSPAAIREAIGMSETQFRTALAQLQTHGYVSNKPFNGEYSAFEMPYNEPLSLENSLKLSRKKKQEKSAACSDREKAKREKASAASSKEPEPDLETGIDLSCTENPIHDELDAEASECENPIHSAPEADTGSAEDEVHTIPETGYRNIKNNIYNKINNIRDYDVERSETSPYPSTGNKFDAVLDGFLSDTGSASFIYTPKKRTAPSSHCRGTNSFAKSEFGFNGEPPF